MNTILRVYDNDNNMYDLDLFQDVDFLLDISAKEAGEIPSVFGITSQQFSVPATNKNNDYFGNLWNLASVGNTSFIQTYPCQVLENGDEVFTGKIYLESIVTDQRGDTIYNVIVINETVDFKKQIENLTWKEVFAYFNVSGSGTSLQAGWNHPYTYGNITSSWDLALPATPAITSPSYLPRPGDIVYPLAEYGVKENSKDVQLKSGGDPGTFTQWTSPIYVDQFKPAIRVNAMMKALMRYTSYEYTSSFFDSPYFDTIYYLTTPTEEKGATTTLAPTASFLANKDTEPDQFLSGSSTLFQQVTYSNEIFDNPNTYNTGTSEYTAPYAGQYSFKTNILYNIQFLQVGVKRRSIQVNLTVNGNPFIVPGQFTDIAKSGFAGTLVVDFGPVNLNVGDQVGIVVQFLTTAAVENFRIFGTNATYFECYSGPAAAAGQQVDFSLWFGEETVQEWLLGLIQKFNLVIEPIKDRKNVLLIEPFEEWREIGQVVDWTNKVDRNVKFEIKHPMQEHAKTVYFSDVEDKDEFNRYSIESLDKIFGNYKYVANTDIAEGESKVGTYFAPTPMKFIEGSPNGKFIVPQIYTDDNGAKRPLKFKPRLLHYIGKQDVDDTLVSKVGVTTNATGSWYMWDENVNRNELFEFPVFHHLSEVPADDNWDPNTNPSTTLDLHFGNLNHWEYHQSQVNAQTYRGAYYEYWANYLNEIYDVDARLVTLNIKLNPVDISQIQLNDKIFIDGDYYRINKIPGASLTVEQSTPVELIKAGTRRNPFVRRRVIKLPGSGGGTGGSGGGGGGVTTDQEYFEDIIIDEFNSNGNVKYVNYNDGTEITDYDLINQAAWADGVQASPSGTFWENIQTPTPTSNINLGNNYIDYRNANNVVIGYNNELLSQGGTNVVVGENNALTTTNGANMVVAQSASVSGVENASVFYPSRDVTTETYNNSLSTGQLIVQSGFAPEYNVVQTYAGNNIYITSSAYQYPYMLFDWSGSVGDSYVYLPDADTLDGVEFRFQLSSSFASFESVLLTPSGSQTIDGAAGKVLTNSRAQYVIKSINGDWKTISPGNVYYGGFFSSGSQPLLTASVSQSITWDATYEANGFSASGSYVYINNPGTYQMTAFFQLTNNSNDAQDVNFWVKYNGSDYPNSGNYTTIRPRKSAGNPSAQLVTVSFIGTSQAAFDTVEIYWAGTSTDLALTYASSGSIDGGPAAPSAVVNFIPIR